MTRTGFRYTKVPLKILLSKAHKEKRVKTTNERITKIISGKRPFLVMRRDSVWTAQMTEGRMYTTKNEDINCQKRQCRGGSVMV